MAFDVGPTTSQRSLGAARVFNGSHSITCHPWVYSQKINLTCLCFPSRSWSSFTDPGRMEGWVGLDTTMVSKQSAQNRYVAEITVVSCSDRHASLGNWKRSRLRASNSRPLGPKAARLTIAASQLFRMTLWTGGVMGSAVFCYQNSQKEGGSTAKTIVLRHQRKI